MRILSPKLLLVSILVVGAALRVWYAAYGLDENRFWDERYNFENVESILDTGSLRPAKVYYPSPLVSWPQAGLLAASEALHRLTGSDAFAIRGPGGFTPTAYLLCRLLSVVYGVASLWVLFLAARRIFDEKVALLATLALTFLPWHIHASGKFKPDALVVLTVVLALHWCLGAVRAGTIRGYAAAGLGIALALSAKLTGGVVAVSLAVGALAAGGAGLMRRLSLLAVAAVVSLVAFLAMNPYGRWYLSFLSGLQRDYEMRAGWSEGTGPIPAQAVRYLFDGYVHGPIVGVLVVIGAIVLGARLVAVRAERLDRAYWAMLLVFPVVFTAAYTIATPYFKGNNFLPVLPFTCILAAWPAWRGWALSRPKLPRSGATMLGAALVAGALAVLVAPGLLYVYRSLVPAAIDLARLAVADERRAPAGRFFYLEPDVETLPEWEGREELNRKHPGFRSIGDLSAVPHERLDLADAEIFPAERLDGEHGDFYRRRLERVGEAGRRFIEPRLFEARGAAAVALIHRLRRGAAGRLEYRGRCRPGKNCFSFALPESVPPGTVVSLEVSVPTAAVDARQPRLGVSVDGGELDTVRVVISGPERAFLTERFRPRRDSIEVRLTDLEPRLLRRQLGFELRSWRAE